MQTSNQPVATLEQAVDMLNLAILQAVDAGMSVELVRSKRHHDGNGNWGDQFAPTCIAPPKTVSSA
jgi:hypothetical protein